MTATLSAKQTPSINTLYADSTIIDCICFRLAKPKHMTLLQVSPSLFRAYEKEHFDNTLSIEVEEKEEYEYEQHYKNFSDFFNNHYLFPRVGEVRPEAKPITINGYNGLVAYDYNNFKFKLLALIDLDETCFLSFYYKNDSIYRNTEQQETTYRSLRQLLDSLELSDNYQAALAELHQQQEAFGEENYMLQCQQHYTNAEEQAVNPFHARQNPELFARFQEKLNHQPSLNQYQDGIISNAHLAIGFIETEKDNYSKKGNIRFGGLPDLPPDIKYPKIKKPWYAICRSKHYAFVAQINCSELKALQNYLPSQGMLYFFVDSFKKKDYLSGSLSAKVIYYPSSTSTLKSAKVLNIKPKQIVDGKIANAAQVRVSPHISIFNPYPDIDGFNFPPVNCPLEGYDEDENNDELEYKNGPFADIERLNGDLIDNNNKRLHAINGNICLIYKSAQEEAARALGGDPQDYIVLLRVEPKTVICNFDLNFSLFFVIHKNKLRSLDFSAVYCNCLMTDSVMYP